MSRFPKRMNRKGHKSLHPQARRSRRLFNESLEDRQMMTTTVFLDFGEGFAAGGLTMTAGELRDTINGPDLTTLDNKEFSPKSSAKYAPDTILAFSPLAAVVRDQQIDFDRRGVAGDINDYVALRDSIVSLVRRHFDPLDVNVVVASAGSLNDVNQALAANKDDTTGQFDAYMFITGVSRTDINLQVGRNTVLYGVAEARDTTKGQNLNDDVGIVFADFFLGQEVAKTQVPFDIAMASVASHEAGHTFAREHSTNPHAREDYQMMIQSDLMVGKDGGDVDLTSIGFFSRFRFTSEDSLPYYSRTSQNAYEEMAADPDIGPHRGLEFVTGTGANDRITIAAISSTQARVTVEAFDDKAKLIESVTYIISTEGSVLVDGGMRNDDVILVGDIGAPVTVRGGFGSDTLEVRPSGNVNSVTVFPDLMKINGEQVRYSELEEIKVTGNSKTILSVENPYATRSQTIGVHSFQVNGVVPVPVSFRGLASLSILAGSKGNFVTVTDTPNVPVTINTGDGIDMTTVLITSSNLTINGQNGADEVTLGQNDQLWDDGLVIHRIPGTPAFLGGTLTISNQNSLTKLKVEDTANKSYRSVGMSMVSGAARLTGFGAAVSYKPTAVSGVDFKGGGGGYQFLIYDTPSRMFLNRERFTTNITTGGGEDLFSIFNTTSPVSINGGMGLNKFNVNVGIKGAVDLNGTLGENRYLFSDRSQSTAGLQYQLSVNQFYRTDSAGKNSTARITFANPSDLEIWGGSGDSRFIVSPNVSAAQSLKIDGGNGADTLKYDDALSAVSQQYLVTPTSVGRLNQTPITLQAIETLEVHGGAKDDTFGMTGPLAGGATKFYAGGGIDTLDYSRYQKNVLVDLAANKATDLALLSGLENAIGGAGNDQLLGSAASNRLDGRGGRDLLIGGMGIDTLLGGDEEDLLLAGSTTHATKATARDAIMAEWTRTDQTYNQRVNHLLNGGGLNGKTLLNRSSYVKDTADNTMTGGTVALDLFFGSLARDAHDRDRTSGEVFVDPDVVENSVQIDATALTATYLSLDYVSYDPTKPFSAQLQAGTHVLIMIGGAMVYFKTDSTGKIDYDPALEGILSGRGTTSLRVNGAPVTVDATALTSDYLSLDTMSQNKAAPISAWLLPGTHSLVTHGGAVIYFTVGNNATIDYEPVLEGILSGRGTNALRMNGAAVTIDATALTSDYLSLNYKAQDITKPVSARLIPGSHFLVTHGGAIVNFTVANDGKIDYDSALDGVLLGRGTSSLHVMGAAVQIDATALSTDYLSMNYQAQDKTAPINARLLPGSHFLVAHGGSIVYFTVRNDGKIDYDLALEGILSGHGTSTLRLHGAATRIDARALSSAYLNLDYTVQDPDQVVSARLLPGLHHIQTYGGSVLFFTVTNDGKVDYDPALEGVFTGRGTGDLNVSGRNITIDATNSSTGYFNLNYTDYAFRSPFTVMLTPGQHFIQASGGLYYFSMSNDGLIDYDVALEGVLTGRGTRTLGFRA